MNKTVIKFGYPNTLIKEYNYWVVLLRPVQITLGSLIIACKEDAENLSKVSLDAFIELKKVLQDVESALTDTFNMDKINYLALMMVDKHVHFHVLPRYANECEFNNSKYIDNAWPGAPVLKEEIILSKKERKILKIFLLKHWNEL